MFGIYVAIAFVLFAAFSIACSNKTDQDPTMGVRFFVFGVLVLLLHKFHYTPFLKYVDVALLTFLFVWLVGVYVITAHIMRVRRSLEAKVDSLMELEYSKAMVELMGYEQARAVVKANLVMAIKTAEANRAGKIPVFAIQ